MTRIFDEKYEELMELNSEKCRDMKSGKLTEDQYRQWQFGATKEFWELLESLDQRPNEDDEYSQRERLLTEEHVFRRGYHHGFCAARSRPDVTTQQVHDWRHSVEDSQWPPGSPMERKEA
jgi:hypothetical protein